MKIALAYGGALKKYLLPVSYTQWEKGHLGVNFLN